jgi:predicted permease
MGELGAIFLDILAPVFLLVAVGFGFGRRLGVDPQPLARSAYFLLAPAFIFEVLAASQLGGDVVVRMVAVLLVTTAGVAFLGWAAGRAFSRTPSVTAALVLVAVYGNVGNFGLPIVAFEFGEGALDLAGVAFLTVNLSAFLIGVTAATWRTSRPARALWTAITTPAVAVVPLAVAVNLTNADLPLFLDRAVGLLADAMIPVMLLTLGVQLARMERPTIGADVMIGAGLRLVAAPLLATLAVAGIGLTGDPAGVTIVQSAMPAAVFTALIAIEHDLEPDLVTTTVLVSTVVSAVTLTIVLALV